MTDSRWLAVERVCGVIRAMSSTDVLSAVRSALQTIADSFADVEFIVPGPDRHAAEEDRRAIVTTIRKYVLPRLREPDAPVVAAFVGLSGVGKSTIVNSLAQDRVSATGVVRPTTKAGVIWAHRAHAARYWTEFVARVREHVGPSTEVVIGDDPLTRYLTLVDVPPVEMAPVGEGGDPAEALMFADLCVFVTSVERYADASPLRFLAAARLRGMPILFVLNRLPNDADTRRDLLRDFAEKLVEAGLIPRPDPGFIFGVAEAAHVQWHGGLEPAAAAVLRKELSQVSDPDFRVIVVDETADATVAAVVDRAERLVHVVEAEQLARRRFAQEATETYGAATEQIRADIDAGRYRELAGHRAWAQAAAGLTGLVTRAAGEAAAATSLAWEAGAGGGGLLEPGHEGLRRHAAGTVGEIGRQLEDWHAGLRYAAERNRRFRPRRRRLRRLVTALWRAALDPRLEPRGWRRDHAPAVLRSRKALADRLAEAVEADGDRFLRRLGEEIPGDLVESVSRAIAYLRELSDRVPQELQTEGAGDAV